MGLECETLVEAYPTLDIHQDSLLADVFHQLRQSRGELTGRKITLPVEAVLSLYYRHVSKWLQSAENLRAILLALASIDRFDLCAIALKLFFDVSMDLKFEFSKQTKHYSVLNLRFISQNKLTIIIDPAVRDHSRDHDLSWLVGMFRQIIFYMDSPSFVAGDIILNHEDRPREPGLAYCANQPEHFLIPDYMFVASNAWEVYKHDYIKNDCRWEERQPIAFWRGSTTGQFDAKDSAWQSLPRISLCELAKDSSNGLIDAGLTSVVQISDPKCRVYLEEKKLLVPYVHHVEFIKYKYQIDIDGNVNSWPGLFQKLMTGSPVIKVASPDGYRQWYYDRLVAWENHIPCSSDMSDLIEKVTWLKAHDATAMNIGRAGRALAMSMTLDTELACGARSIADAIKHFERTNAMTNICSEISHLLYAQNIWLDFKSTRPKPDHIQGWNGNHPSFRLLLQDLPSPVVIDVGVWKGQSTVFLAKELFKINNDGCVIAVDTFLGSREHWDRQADLFERIVGRPDLYDIFLNNIYHNEVSNLVIPLPQTSVTAAEILHGKGIKAGLVHIDASHEYEDVLRDLRLYWPIIEIGGYLVADDYDPSWPGVVAAVDEFCKGVICQVSISHPKFIIKKLPEEIRH